MIILKFFIIKYEESHKKLSIMIKFLHKILSQNFLFKNIFITFILDYYIKFKIFFITGFINLFFYSKTK